MEEGGRGWKRTIGVVTEVAKPHEHILLLNEVQGVEVSIIRMGRKRTY